MKTHLKWAAALTGAWYLAISLFGSAAMAGGWVSGGGELMQDDRNPWWLDNTESVSYCIQNTPESGVSTATAIAAFEQAVGYWQSELRDTPTDYLYSLDRSQRVGVFIGTQAFNRQACQAGETNLGVDLAIQLGWLTEEQHEYLEDPRRFVGVNVRTTYDRANLRGTGFIYISPEHGSLAMNHPGIVDNVWSERNGQRLALVLIHELGHSFGLTHARRGGLMDHDFPVRAVTSEARKLPRQEFPLPKLFRHMSEFMVTAVDVMQRDYDNLRAVFRNLMADDDLFQMDFNENNTGVQSAIFYAGKGGAISATRPIATANFDRSTTDWIPLVNLYLTEQQAVFPSWVVPFQFHEMAQASRWVYTGKLQQTGEPDRNMILYLDSQSVSFGGEDSNGNLLPRIFKVESWWQFGRSTQE